MKNILYSKPSITKLEEEYVYDAIKNGWGENCYDYIYKFQDAYKKFLNTKFAMATSSCTGALHIALKALGVTTGDEVIVPDVTWVASVAPITYLSAKPVFVDVLESTWCIDPNKIEQAITEKTKAIIVVHLYGNMSEMDEILKISKKYNIPIIEDSAEAIGSEYKGKKAGTIGDFGVYSFHGTKTLTSGEGGMLITNNKNLHEKALILNDHGRDPKINRTFWAETIGFKYRMSNLQAALGYAQTLRIEELIAKKIKIFNLYKQELSNLNHIQLNFEQSYVKNSYWMPTIIFEDSLKINRDLLLIELNKQGIGARPFFYPVSTFPEFETKIDNKVSTKLSQNGINLPSNFDMDISDIKYVVSAIRQYLGQ